MPLFVCPIGLWALPSPMGRAAGVRAVRISPTELLSIYAALTRLLTVYNI
jgi:hypothetical protein